MKIKHWLYFIGLSLAWGSSFFWIKIALNEVGPFMLVALRMAFGAAGLLAVILIQRPKWPQDRRVWLVLALLGLTNTAIPFTLISWGEIYVDSAVASILNSSVPIFTTIIAHFFLNDDRLSLTRVLGLVIGFGGVVMVLWRGAVHPDSSEWVTNNLLGQLAVVLAAVLYAGSAVLARRYGAQLSPAIQAVIPLLVGDAFMWLAVALVDSPVVLPALPITWGALAWLGLIGSCLAYLFYFSLLHEIGPTRATLVTYTFPVIGVLMGVLFLGEHLDWQLALGGALVVGSIAIVNRQKKAVLAEAE